MSTWVYLVCRDHNPPLVAEDESGQHLYDLPRIRQEIVDRERVVELWMEHDLTLIDDHFGRNTARFLTQHQKCRIGIIDEYRRTHAVESTPDLADDALDSVDDS